MQTAYKKIINDPVYGFISIHDALLFQLIAHPHVQRLRRIRQMALAELVYPGAVHTRFHHSLGAYHLVSQAVTELKNKGISISFEEERAVKAAILLHDIGHGPFSHTLENVLLPQISHETIGLAIAQDINNEFNNELQLSIQILNGAYSKPFLQQLISGQLDMDRMDYLSRDSFFTGVSEGVIGYDRILKMLIVHHDELMVEEKGIYSVEKFLVARRQMYWQVYLHKTVLAAEQMLTKIIQRAKEIYAEHKSSLFVNEALDVFLSCSNVTMQYTNWKELFCSLGDEDILFAIKKWSHSNDVILSTLCLGLLNRKLFKCTLRAMPFEEEQIIQLQQEAARNWHIPQQLAHYFVFSDEAVNTTYQIGGEQIHILYKNGTVRDISEVDNPLINRALSQPVKKFYLCRLPYE